MFEKVYRIMLWIGVFFGALYLPTRYEPFGFIGGLVIFALAIIKVAYDTKHHQLPWQKQKEALREEGLAMKQSDLKRNTQKKEDAPAGMKRVKKRELK